MKEKQYWKYNSNIEDSNSYLLIQKIDKVKSIVHVSVYGVNLEEDIFDISHIPIDYHLLKKSLINQILNLEYKSDDLFVEGYRNWETEKGGVWEIDIKDVIETIKESILHNEDM